MLDSQIGVGKCLSLNALGGVYYQQCALTGSQRTGDFVVKVDVSRSVDEVEFIGVAILGSIFHLDGTGLDGDAAFPLQLHVVQQLVLHLTQRDGLGFFQDAVGKGRLAVVDMGNDAEIADTADILLRMVWHEISPFYQIKNQFRYIIGQNVRCNNLLYHKMPCKRKSSVLFKLYHSRWTLGKRRQQPG